MLKKFWKSIFGPHKVDAPEKWEGLPPEEKSELLKLLSEADSWSKSSI